MLQKFLLIISLVSFSFAADAMEKESFLTKNQLADIHKELGDERFNEEIKVYQRNYNKLKLIKHQKEREKLSKEVIYSAMDKLVSLQRSTNSLIVSWIIMNEYIYNLNVKDVQLMEKYMRVASKHLVDNNMCDGYIYYGEYLENTSFKKDALVLYKNGVKKCKIEWKNRMVLSRYRKLKYQMRDK